MSGFKWFYTSSNLIKEVARFGGSVRGLVPENVYSRLMERFGEQNQKAK
jgi:pantetheine-phosphate adenylyltransferase